MSSPERADVAQYATVLESDNADMCTKGLNAELMTRHMSAVDGRCSAGGAQKSLG